MKTKVDLVHMGTVDLGEKMMISDPCYLKGDITLKSREDCQGDHLYDVYAGIINLTDSGWGRRVAFIELNSIDTQFAINQSEWAGDLSVDSGTMSISSLEDFNERVKDENFEAWYKKEVVDKSREKVNLADGGECVICSSGLGDGLYPLYVNYNKDNEIDSLYIEFIEPNSRDNGFEWDGIESIDEYKI